MLRQTLLKASENRWLRENASSSRFLRRSVLRFLPGERVEDALRASGDFAKFGIGTVLTHLGENVADRDEATAVTRHYASVLELIRSRAFASEISVKLTQLGLDLDQDHASLPPPPIVRRWAICLKALWHTAVPYFVPFPHQKSSHLVTIAREENRLYWR